MERLTAAEDNCSVEYFVDLNTSKIITVRISIAYRDWVSTQIVSCRNAIVIIVIVD